VCEEEKNGWWQGKKLTVKEHHKNVFSSEEMRESRRLP
jgi:hypothetical protein